MQSDLRRAGEPTSPGGPAPVRGGALGRGGRFAGLDTLRFIAAMFVVIGHIPLNQASAGLPHPSWGALFFRGAPAVKLFFSLSGFLITYLLLDEMARTGTVAVGRFYLRRVCRIWPLYFSVAALGLAMQEWILPRLGYGGRHTFDWRLAAILYAAFLPNLMNSLAAVGGILNPLWSIGIEEQFYLFWAPATRRFRRHLPRFILTVLLGSLALFFAQWAGLFGDGRFKGFVDQLEFHYMAGGALTAWALHEHREALLDLPLFRSRVVQAIGLLLLVEYYVVGLLPWGVVGEELMQLVLYPWLIVNVSANPRRLVRLDWAPTERLGVVSYGIYMLHMPVVWATSYAFVRTGWLRDSPAALVVMYYATAIGLVLAVASASYRWFETPFLRLKDRRYAAPA